VIVIPSRADGEGSHFSETARACFHRAPYLRRGRASGL